MANCPHCSEPLPEGLPSHDTATDFPKMGGDLRLKIGDLNRKWSLHPFASGWGMIDVAVRVITICVLVWVTISLNAQVDAAQQTGKEKLATHTRYLEEPPPANVEQMKVKYEQMRINYQNLQSSTEELFAAQVKDGKLHVILLLAFIAFLGVSAMSIYKTHVELAKLRTSFEFLFTYEGRKWLDREAPRQEAPAQDGGKTSG